MNAISLPYRLCVGLMLVNPEGLVFCGERRDTPGAWQMPQGGIQKDEAPLTAAFREMKEEIGVTKAELLAQARTTFSYDFPDYLERHSVYKGKYRGQEQHWFAFRFTGGDADIDLITHNDHEGPEFSQWRWVEAQELPRLIVPFKRKVYESVVTEFAPVIEKLKAGK